MEASGNKNVSRVLIVGGGPAGSAAAIYCAKYGHQVILIESEKFPRRKPGETLHPGVDVIFRQLGVYDDIQNANFVRHDGVCVKWSYNEPPKTILFGKDNNEPWLGYQAFRADLDDILLSRARDVGAMVMQPCRACDILVESEQVIGVKTSSAGEVLGDFIIDASGGGHWLARKLNLTIEKHSSPLYARYGYAKGKCHARDQVPLIEATPDGWIWTAKVKNGLYQWTRLNFHKVSIAPNWLPDEFTGLKSSQAIHGADVTWRQVIQPAGPGYFIIGDAATVVDPASSHGVLKGLMSGIKAAHIISRIFKDKFPSTIASLDYNKWVSQWFFHDIAKLRELYMQHPSHPILVR